MASQAAASRGQLGSRAGLRGAALRHRAAPPRRAAGAPRVLAMAGGTTVTVLYRTQWEACQLHYSEGSGGWSSVPMSAVASQDGWRSATVQASEALHFCVSDGAGAWDNADAVPGRNYVATRAGTYRLCDGNLMLLPPKLPLLLVSDLDGTMVGDDAGTRAFSAYWTGVAAATGSRLVYSTGRALDSFLELAAEKGDMLPRPDVLICAVGTKVYLPQDDGSWKEDPAWTARLDDGWAEATMREACLSALSRAGTENAHFRPAAEMNNHKLTLGVRDAAVADFTAEVSAAAAAAGLRAKVIASGTGGWRYVDVVSAGAGKLESLEYVREMLGFDLSSTVAAGDSGNDVAMLSGRNRAIVVGNAQPDLVAWAAQACGMDGGDRCAFPDSDPEPQSPPLMSHGLLAAPMHDDDSDSDVVDVEATAVSASRPVDDAPDAIDVEAMALEVQPSAVAVAERPPPEPQAAPAEAAPEAAAVAVAAGEEVDGARLYCSSATQAWGIIEGLQHFGFA